MDWLITAAARALAAVNSPRFSEAQLFCFLFVLPMRFASSEIRSVLERELDRFNRRLCRAAQFVRSTSDREIASIVASWLANRSSRPGAAQASEGWWRRVRYQLARSHCRGW